jgi:hypothetical protein
MPRAKDIFEEWKVAHRSATMAEDAMLKKSFAYLDGTGPAPVPAEGARARRLRDTATDLLAIAMDRMAAEAGELRDAGPRPDSASRKR